MLFVEPERRIERAADELGAGPGTRLTMTYYTVGTDDELSTEQAGFQVVGVLPMAGLGLAQNAPNPFNPSTKISFRLDQDGPVKLEVFNARGQLVRVLADEAMGPGRHEIPFDGTGLPSGPYHYRLEGAGPPRSGSMMLVK